MDNSDFIKENIDKIRSKILLFDREIQIMAVTKNVSIENIEIAINNGITDIGENKVQEALPKIETLKKNYGNFKFHFIGHLQTNKVNKITGKVDLIQSVDGLKLAEKISSTAASLNLVQDVLLELRVSEEETKYGIRCEDMFKEYELINKLTNVKIKGIMTMAPYFDEMEKSRPYFKKAKKIFDALKETHKNSDFKILSMGMTDDFMIALEEGATMIRIGTGIFGKRSE
jgi:pyridoxal phosphate enzyme (YggS family)